MKRNFKPNNYICFGYLTIFVLLQKVWHVSANFSCVWQFQPNFGLFEPFSAYFCPISAYLGQFERSTAYLVCIFLCSTETKPNWTIQPRIQPIFVFFLADIDFHCLNAIGTVHRHAPLQGFILASLLQKKKKQKKGQFTVWLKHSLHIFQINYQYIFKTFQFLMIVNGALKYFITYSCQISMLS